MYLIAIDIVKLSVLAVGYDENREFVSNERATTFVMSTGRAEAHAYTNRRKIYAETLSQAC